MKLTKTQLKQIIKEELNEMAGGFTGKFTDKDFAPLEQAKTRSPADIIYDLVQEAGKLVRGLPNKSPKDDELIKEIEGVLANIRNVAQEL